MLFRSNVRVTRKSIVDGIATESHATVAMMDRSVEVHAIFERCLKEAMTIRVNIGSMCALEPQTMTRLDAITRNSHEGAVCPFSYIERKQLIDSTDSAVDNGSMLADTA